MRFMRRVVMFLVVSLMVFGVVNAQADDYKKHSIMFNPLGSYYFFGNMFEDEYSWDGSLNSVLSYSPLSAPGGVSGFSGSSADFMIRWHWDGNGVSGGYIGLGVNNVNAKYSADYEIAGYKESISSNVNSTGLKAEVGGRKVWNNGISLSYFLAGRQANMDVAITNSRGQTTTLFKGNSSLTSGVIPMFGFALGYSF